MAEIALVEAFEQNRLIDHDPALGGHRTEFGNEVRLREVAHECRSESETAWFQYPLQGTPPVVVSLAQAVGGSIVSVRIDGASWKHGSAPCWTCYRTPVDGCRPHFTRQSRTELVTNMRANAPREARKPAHETGCVRSQSRTCWAWVFGGKIG